MDDFPDPVPAVRLSDGTVISAAGRDRILRALGGEDGAGGAFWVAAPADAPRPLRLLRGAAGAPADPGRAAGRGPGVPVTVQTAEGPREFRLLPGPRGSAGRDLALDLPPGAEPIALHAARPPGSPFEPITFSGFSGSQSGEAEAASATAGWSARFDPQSLRLCVSGPGRAAAPGPLAVAELSTRGEGGIWRTDLELVVPDAARGGTAAGAVFPQPPGGLRGPARLSVRAPRAEDLARLRRGEAHWLWGEMTRLLALALRRGEGGHWSVRVPRRAPARLKAPGSRWVLLVGPPAGGA